MKAIHKRKYFSEAKSSYTWISKLNVFMITLHYLFLHLPPLFPQLLLSCSEYKSHYSLTYRSSISKRIAFADTYYTFVHFYMLRINIAIFKRLEEERAFAHICYMVFRLAASWRVYVSSTLTGLERTPPSNTLRQELGTFWGGLSV